MANDGCGTTQLVDGNIFQILLKDSAGEDQQLDVSSLELCAHKLFAEAEGQPEAERLDAIKERLINAYQAVSAIEQGNKDISKRLALWRLRFEDKSEQEIMQIYTVWSVLLDNVESWKYKQTWLDKLIEKSNQLAEGANVGIALHVVGQWIPLFSFSIFAFISSIADPAIYAFRAIGRWLRTCGRALGMDLEEEKHGQPKFGDIADLVCLIFFALAACVLAGLIIPGPVGVVFGWLFAMTALSVMTYFDYYKQELLALEKLESAKRDHEQACAEADDGVIFCDSNKLHNKLNEKKIQFLQGRVEKAETAYIKGSLSRKFYMSLLIALTVLMICSSAAAIAPPAVALMLNIFAKAASASLILINLGRVANYFRVPFFLKLTGQLNPTTQVAEADEEKQRLLELTSSKYSDCTRALNAVGNHSESSECKVSPHKTGFLISSPAAMYPHNRIINDACGMPRSAEPEEFASVKPQTGVGN